MEQDMKEKLALLTDVEAELCINGLLKGQIIHQPEYAELLGSSEKMREVVSEATDDAGIIERLDAVIAENNAKAIRTILVQLANDEAYSERLEAWLDNARPTLLEPVTGALVLAGLILILSTHVKIDYEDKNGEKSLKVHIEKKPTSQEILKKFFRFFPG